MRNVATLAAFTAILLVGCAAVPIANVSSTPVTTTSSKTLNQEQVRAAIIRAGVGLGWQIKDENQNILVGTISLRTHSATVEIPYSSTAYSIKYRSSENLGEKNGTIHKNYSGWVRNLNRDINAELSKL